jgi:hypothetical protein
MVMVSHIDADHITGLLDLFRDLERAQENRREPFCKIRTLWHNSFERIHHGKAATVQSAAVSATLGGVVASGLEEKALPWSPASGRAISCATLPSGSASRSRRRDRPAGPGPGVRGQANQGLRQGFSSRSSDLARSSSGSGRGMAEVQGLRIHAIRNAAGG